MFIKTLQNSPINRITTAFAKKSSIMKYLLCLVFAALLVATQADSPREKIRKYSDECKAETGVSDESITKARNGEEVDDPKLKEQAFCILKKSGFQNQNGDLLIDTIRQKFKEHVPAEHHEDIEKLITKCTVQKDTPQNTAAAFLDCILKARAEHKHKDD